MKKGISLIVLIVTIIIMIIIAGAVIISLSEINVIDQAESAVQKHNDANEKDILVLAWGEYMASLLSNPTAELKVEGATVTGDNTSGWTVIFTSGNKYHVSSKGEITKEGVQEGPVIDDTKVEAILVKLLQGDTDKGLILELKQELNLEHVNENDILDILYMFSHPTKRDEDGNYNMEIYFYEIDRIYLLSIEYDENENEKYEVKYESKEENKELYEYAAKLEQIRQELEVAFVGKTVSEMQEKYTDRTLEQYILDNCKSIKTIELSSYFDDTLISDMTFEYSNMENEFFGDTLRFNTNEEGKYIRVTIAGGS